jgi:hypothetical protein
MIIIKTYDELDNWLEKYNYFEDGHVLKIDMNPFVITIGVLISGTYEANTEKEILSFEITPINVSSCNYTPDFEPSDDHYIESIEPVEAYGGVGLQILGPPLLTLIAESFTIFENATIKSIFKPWISRRDIFVQAPMEKIPKPEFWQEEFKKLGYDIVFRYYAGESKPLQQLYSNYVGFFFQLENRVNTTNQGIFIRYCSIEKQEVSMSFQQCDPDLDSLWTALTTILASIPEVKISCGNCKFTGAEWKRMLARL